MIPVIHVPILGIGPASVRVLLGEHVIDTGADQGIVLGHAEGSQRVEEFAKRLRVLQPNRFVQVGFQVRILVGKPLGRDPVLAVVVERVDDVGDAVSDVIELGVVDLRPRSVRAHHADPLQNIAVRRAQRDAVDVAGVGGDQRVGPDVVAVSHAQL